MESIKISVIIPVYNSEAYLSECLDSIFSQTFSDFEVICINDGSTDHSLDILEHYKAMHPNMLILSQPNLHAGVARNLGMKNANGEYFLFLDSDDTFSPYFFEKMYKHISSYNADICICEANHLNNETKELISAPPFIKNNFLPTNDCFSKKDIPDHILNFTSTAAWNKIFSSIFIKKHDLEFQDLRRANDLFFVNSALLCADKIVTLPDKLVNYRINQDSNLQSGNSETPLLFWEAIKKLNCFMIENDLLTSHKKSFQNFVLKHCVYNINSVTVELVYHELFTVYKNEIFPICEINEISPDSFYSPSDSKTFEQLQKYSYNEFLFYQLLDQKNKNKKLTFKVKALRAILEKSTHKKSGFLDNIKKIIKKR